MAFTHTIYDNFFLSNEVEDQYKSHLDLQQFCTVDNSLVGQPGMKRKINVYKATDGTEKLAMGAGNSKTIQVSYTEEEYEILLAQNRFEYYDEQAMTCLLYTSSSGRTTTTPLSGGQRFTYQVAVQSKFPSAFSGSSTRARIGSLYISASLPIRSSFLVSLE